MKVYVPLLFFGLFTWAQPTHESWTSLLKVYVDEAGNVDYKSWQKNPDKLIEYIQYLEGNTPKEDWSKPEKLSYWINVYNACTVKLILDHYPLKSILLLVNPWRRDVFLFQGNHLTLNQIEHEILRKMNTPQIHFAINCASRSCPNLEKQAYEAHSLHEQLSRATKKFLNDPSKNNLNKPQFQLSKIFKWFEEDFLLHGSVLDFINLYMERPLKSDHPIKYQRYDWSLNEK
jgi:hypothetical protein